MDAHQVVTHVLEIVDNEAHARAAGRVRRIKLAVGGRFPVTAGELQIAFHHAARGTVAEGAELAVHVMDVQRHCRNCAHDFATAPGSTETCPACGHPRTKPLGGEEVRVVEMVVDDKASA
jgi:hydrogenase nickel incorporation protein HypA/HybF